MTPYNTCRTKAGRKHMIKELVALCEAEGLSFTKEDITSREVYIKISRGDHHLSFDIDATCPAQCFLLSWYSRNQAKYPTSFYGGDVNQFHYGKATAVVYTLEEAIRTIRNGFQQLHAIEAWQSLCA